MSTRAWRRLTALGALSCALAATLVVALGCERAPDKARAQARELPALAPLWQAGRQATFGFELSSTTSLAEMPNASELALAGSVEIRVVRGEGSRLVLLVAPRGVKLEKPRGAQPDPVALLLREMEQPFAVELEAGALVAYLEPTESSMLAFGLRRQLAVVLQRAEPAKPGDRAADGSWAAQEWDASGRATVHYAQRAGEPGAFSWRKEKYDEVLAVRGAQAALPDQSWKPEIVESKGSLRLYVSSLVEVERAEVVQTALTRDQKLRTQYRVHYARVGEARQGLAPGLVPAQVAGLVRRLPADPPPLMSTETLDALRFAGRTFDEVLTMIKGGEESPAGTSPKDQLAFRSRQMGFHALVGLFRTSEANIELAVALVRKDDPRAPTLLRSLAAASTPRSLEVLVQLALDRERPTADRQRAAANLLRAESPAPGLEPALESFVADASLREHGLLGLGTFARRWRKGGHAAAADAAAARLGRELAAAEAPAEQVRCLLAVANSGEVSLFEAAVKLQGSSDDKVREAAIQAVRLMDDPRVEPSLAKLLSGAESPGLVAATLTALAQRNGVAEGTVQLVEQQTAPAVDAAVRRQAALTLVAWKKDWPRLTATLARLETEDPDERVREAARSKSSR